MQRINIKIEVRLGNVYDYGKKIIMIRAVIFLMVGWIVLWYYTTNGTCFINFSLPYSFVLVLLTR